jgi:hypothetical protein
MTKLITEITRIRLIMGLTENIQLADKLYFKPGLLSDEVRNEILNITDGDNFTKLVTDLYMQFNRFKGDNSPNIVQSSLTIAENFYDELINYNKKLFPVPGNLADYTFQTDSNDWHIITLYELLKDRNSLVYQWSKVPNIIRRNLGKALNDYLYSEQKPNQNLSAYFKGGSDIIKEINEVIKLMPQRKFEEVVPKLFSSNKTLQNMRDGIINLRNTLSMLNSNMGIDMESVLEMVQTVDANVTQQTDHLLVIRVNDAEAMQTLGCYSSWCFAVPGGDEYWDGEGGYAGRGYVYIIYDFYMDIEDARFMQVYLPDSGELYMSNNIPFRDQYDAEPYGYLVDLGVDTNKLV